MIGDSGKQVVQMDMRRLPFLSRGRDAAYRLLAHAQGAFARSLALFRADNPPQRYDVTILTDWAFRGGTRASSATEAAYLESRGVRVGRVHCPSLGNIRRKVDCASLHDWRNLASIDTKVLILRHPSVVTSPAFQWVKNRIRADHCFIVINNSRFLADGRAAYSMAGLVRTAQSLNCGHVVLCPVSPLIRAELEGKGLPLSSGDWVPTLDIATYFSEPQPAIGPDLTIGRHGRDGPEKWLEAPRELLLAYPSRAPFQIFILGGAEVAFRRLGGRPPNWTVAGFGTMAVRDYLEKLDAFVYFPHSKLREGFGRSVAEAMLAGRACILSRSLAPNFNDLAFYCLPGQVPELVGLLASDDAGRVAFLKEVQNIACFRHGQSNIDRHLAETGLWSNESTHPALSLSPAARQWRSEILAALS